MEFLKLLTFDNFCGSVILVSNRQTILFFTTTGRQGTTPNIMQLRNSTNIPNDTIRELIRFVRPNGISNFDVMVKNTTHGCCGRAYWYGCSFHHSINPFIVVRLQKNELNKPYRFRGGNGYIPSETFTRMEMFIHVLAHELRHLWQAKHKRGKVWGARGKFSERDADAYAIHKVREYRKSETHKAK